MDIPLIVDLDGTIIKSDLLFEQINMVLIRSPFKIFQVVILLFLYGKVKLKLYLSNITSIEVNTLPYNFELINWLKKEKIKGRYVVLATASHSKVAKSVANHLNFFDDVLATEGCINLKGVQKKRLLISMYGEKGFDYVGNESSDLAVWNSARYAHVVSSSPSLIAKVKLIGNLAHVFDDGRPHVLRALINAIRPLQWLKNLLIFAPLFAAQLYGDIPSIINSSLAFIAFGLTASSAYILNDLVDINIDRLHPRKKFRPFAAGSVFLLYGWFLWPTLIAVAFAISIWTLPIVFVVVQAIYLALTFAYSFFLKKKVFLDVITLAGLYTMRIIAGIAAISVSLSFWLLSFSMFIFLSLALVKRFSEIKVMQSSVSSLNLPGRGYLIDDLELVSSMGISAGYISVLVLAFYIQDVTITHLYNRPEFIWLTCPLSLFWISRIWLIAHRGEMYDDPVFFAAKDNVSWFILSGFVALFLLARFL